MAYKKGHRLTKDRTQKKTTANATFPNTNSENIQKSTVESVKTPETCRTNLRLQIEANPISQTSYCFKYRQTKISLKRGD